MSNTSEVLKQVLKNKQFRDLHQENSAAIERLAQIYLRLWTSEGRPMKEPTEKMKHVWTRIAGVIDRCNRILAGKDE